MRRLPDWQERLTAVLAASFDRPFDNATFNCGLFAAQAIEALTGVELSAGDAAGGGPIEDIAVRVMAKHGFPQISPSFATIGDIVLTDTDDPWLGVCIGEEFLAPAETGLTNFPMSEAIAAWRI